MEGMNILKTEILPLFEITRKSKNVEPNQLIQTDLNEYALYVDLKDIYLNKDQFHTILINHQKLEYTIPLHYHQIVLQGKGYYYQDIVIKIYSCKNSSFFRINGSDLLTCVRVKYSELVNSDPIKIRHLDDEELEIQCKIGQSLIKIPNKGLPTADRNRGALYCLIKLIDDEDESEVKENNLNRQSFDEEEYQHFLDILNYHDHSNITMVDSIVQNENNKDQKDFL